MNDDLISRTWLKEHKFTTQVCNGVEIEDVDVVGVATIDNAPPVDRPQGDLISRSALKEDFVSRLALCNEWIEKAKDEETKIRADATKHFICEVIMTIDNAQTVESDKDLYEKIETYKNAYRIMSDAFENEVRKNKRPQTISCFNCKHDYKSAADEPCKYCEKHCEWQAKEADND